MQEKQFFLNIVYMLLSLTPVVWLQLNLSSLMLIKAYPRLKSKAWPK